MKQVKTRYIIFILAGVLLLSAMVVLLNGQTTKASPLIDKTVDFSVGKLPNAPVIVHKGETRIVPFTVVYWGNKPLNINMTVTEQGKEGIATFSHKQIFPQGILAAISKTSENIPASTQTDLIDRDAANLTITVDPLAKDGIYQLSIVLSKDDDTGKLLAFGYINVKVEG